MRFPRLPAAMCCAVFLVLAGAVAPASGKPAAPSASTIIAVDATTSQGTVSKAVLGHAYLWPFAGMGSFDEQSDQFYGKFVHQLRDVIQPGSLRWPGGITGETFHWQRAIGPQAQRTPNAFGPSSGPSASSVGPDEFGHLLDETGAVGIGTAAFATGSAAEAAAFVAYMTSTSGLWAQLRARNGHPRPYDVPYWEVGNEESGAAYWRSGTPVTVGGPPGACQSVATCLYIYGGSTRFTRQPVVGYADRTPQAADSTGTPGQQFYVAYPQVTPGTATVYVGGVAWTQVASLDTAGPADDVYTLDPKSGAITFGDGVHGAIPPSGAQVTASYVSGPHDGFVQYYRAIKAVNPNVQVCSSNESSDFIASMGSTVPYDCLQHHGNYVSTGTVANDVPIDQYEKQIMAGPDNQAARTAALEASIEQHAGHPVPLVITEYGQLLSSNPDGYPYYHESLDEALLNASQLASFVRMGVPVADRQLLTAEIPPPSQCCAGLPGAAPFATTGAIGTPGPNTVLEATGQVYNLFAPLAGGTVLATQTIGNPALTGSVGTLDTVAVRSGHYVYVIGINRSPSDAVRTRMLLKGVAAAGPASVTTLDGPSALSYNTAAAPQTVRLEHSELHSAGSDVDVTFPAHSATAIRLPVRTTQAWPLSAQLAAQSGLVAPGGQLTVQATVRNDGDTPASGRIEPQLPAGWGSRPPAAAYTVAPHGTTSVEFRISVPGDAVEKSYQLAALLFAPDGSFAGLATTDVIVRQLRNWTAVFTDTFDGQQVGATPAGYTVSGPPGSFTVQPSPSGTGNALRVQKASPGGLMTATRSFDPISGDVRLLLSVWAAQTDAPLGIQLLDSSGAPVVKLSLATGGDIAWTDGTTFVRGATYTTGRWYTLEIDTDPTAGSYKFYVDNVLTAQPALNAAAGLPAAVLLQMPGSPNTPGTFYADDLSIAVPAP